MTGRLAPGFNSLKIKVNDESLSCVMRSLTPRFLVSRYLHRLVALVLAIFVFLVPAQPALASVHRYDEGVDQVMYRSQQSLRDGKDQAWQAVLFKRRKSGLVETLHLRLVGFPGVVEVDHDRPLRMIASTDHWQVEPANVALPANVGEFDLMPQVSHLDSDSPLRLMVPVKGGVAELVAPPFVVREWRSVVERFDAKGESSLQPS